MVFLDFFSIMIIRIASCLTVEVDDSEVGSTLVTRHKSSDRLAVSVSLFVPQPTSHPLSWNQHELTWKWSLPRPTGSSETMVLP